MANGLEENERGLIHIGLVIDAEDKVVYPWANWLTKVLCQELEETFPDFLWRFSLLERQDFPKNVPVDPLVLLEFGSDIKIEYGFDYVLVLTSLSMKSRFNQGINAVPSNMLETAVITVCRILELKERKRQEKALLGLVRHCLGHLWGLEHQDKSVMKPKKFWTGEPPLEWTREEKVEILHHLKKVADPRVEEKADISSSWRFYLKVLNQEGRAIFKDIVLSRFLLMLFHLGRFTAATVVSIIFLFLSAEAWEMGAAVKSGWLNLVLVGVIFIATLSIYFGQNLHAIGRSDKMKEQAVRSRVVLLGTLFVGIVSFWINLFIISYLIINILPEGVLAGWAGIDQARLPAFHFSKLMATFGVLASAVGGNLEEEQDIKALLVYTEET